jgi:hypothetical protein
MADGNSFTFFDPNASISINRSLRKYQWLLELSRKHRSNPLLLQDIVDLLDEIKNLRKEKSSISVGLVLSNENTMLESPYINQNVFHISDLSNFLKLDSIVDGTSLSYLVDQDGHVCVGRIPVNLLKNSPQNTLKNVSQTFQTITFYVGKPLSAVYDDGVVIRLNREGIWLKPCSMNLADLTSCGFPLGLLNHVLAMCQKMSIARRGCTFIIIKGTELTHCSSMLGDCKFVPSKVEHLQESEIMKLAALDGAVILNVNSTILGVAEWLEAPSGSKFVKEAGRGTRHDSAAKYTGAVDCLAFVVSENGPITLFFKGDIFARCYGEIFGYQ